MTPKEKAAFTVDESKCIHCGRCVAVCTGMVLHLDENGIPRMDEFERFGWRGPSGASPGSGACCGSLASGSDRIPLWFRRS